MKTVVVLGAGFAGLKTVVALQKKLREQVKMKQFAYMKWLLAKFPTLGCHMKLMM